jgi:phosphoglycerate-specific signal transduction histidine kinase
LRLRIERVFFNLIANAFEAMPGGGKVRIGARKAGACVLVEVEDTGPGIPGCIRDRLFEPFVTSGKRDGLGFGSRSPVRLFAATAATFGLSQPLAPVSLSVFRWIKQRCPVMGRLFGERKAI